MLSVQSAQRAYAPPPELRSPRGLRDPWLLLGALAASGVALGWRNNPPLPSSSIDLPLRLLQLLLAAVPVLLMVAFLCAILRTRVGGTGAVAPVALVGAATLWVLVLASVLVLQGADNLACVDSAPCPTRTGDRVVLGGVLAALWIGARLIEGTLVRRRAGR